MESKGHTAGRSRCKILAARSRPSQRAAEHYLWPWRSKSAALFAFLCFAVSFLVKLSKAPGPHDRSGGDISGFGGSGENFLGKELDLFAYSWGGCGWTNAELAGNLFHAHLSMNASCLLTGIQKSCSISDSSAKQGSSETSKTEQLRTVASRPRCSHHWPFGAEPGEDVHPFGFKFSSS